jgi:hypothetical protein
MMSSSDDSTTTESVDLEDIADEFCYELAMALRRILGLPTPWSNLDEEDEDGDTIQQE